MGDSKNHFLGFLFLREIFGKTDDPIKYFAASENQDLGVIKYLRKPVTKLDLSPFPAPS
ncbi:MAG: hypothetical protein RMY34_23410 [Aulosira sp. DedQUE10]|nr:hypothetical protein [Aulosira sp. DedQUE10]